MRVVIVSSGTMYKYRIIFFLIFLIQNDVYYTYWYRYQYGTLMFWNLDTCTYSLAVFLQHDNTHACYFLSWLLIWLYAHEDESYCVFKII